MNQESSAALRLDWGARTEAILSNNGNAISISPSAEIRTSVRSDEYTLLRCDFRVGSEHTLMEEQQAMEVQCVHNSGSGRNGIVAMMWKLGGRFHPFLGSIAEDLPGPGGRESPVTVNFDDLFDGMDTTKYWSYVGSMTTPPCSENVDWYVFMDRPMLTSSQLATFEEAIGSPPGNFRPPQPLHGRSIQGCGALEFAGGCECIAVTYPTTGEVVPAQCGPHMGDNNEWCYIHEDATGCGTGVQVAESNLIDGMSFKYCTPTTGEISSAHHNARTFAILAFAGAVALRT